MFQSTSRRKPIYYYFIGGEIALSAQVSIHLSAEAYLLSRQFSLFEVIGNGFNPPLGGSLFTIDYFDRTPSKSPKFQSTSRRKPIYYTFTRLRERPFGLVSIHLSAEAYLLLIKSCPTNAVTSVSIHLSAEAYLLFVKIGDICFDCEGFQSTSRRKPIYYILQNLSLMKISGGFNPPLGGSLFTMNDAGINYMKSRGFQSTSRRKPIYYMILKNLIQENYNVSIHLSAEAYLL